MKQLQSQVASLFRSAIERVLTPIGSAVVPEVALVVARPQFGDYQCNNAMSLFKQYGKELSVKNPKEMAEKIHDALGPDATKAFESIVVAPAGFITVKLSFDWIQSEIVNMTKNGVVYRDPVPKRVSVDFSSPNIAKEMHVGHMRSTILGETVCRMLEDSGHTVFRINHVGDWGTQFGMLIEYIKEEYPDFLTNRPDIADLEGFYKAAKRRFDADSDFKL